MAAFRNLKVSQKLFCCFGFILLLFIILAACSLTALLRMGSSIDALATTAMPSMRGLADIRYSFSSVRRADALMLQCDADDCVQRFLARRQDAVTNLSEALGRYEKLISSPEERALYDSFRESTAAYVVRSAEASKQLVQNHSKETAIHIINDPGTMALYDKSIDAITKDMSLNNKTVTEAGASSLALEKTVVLTICIISVLSLGLCIFIGALLSRTIAVPLRVATEALERFAQRDLTIHVDTDRKDEAGRLCVALNASVESMRLVLRALQKSSLALTESVQDVCHRAEESKEHANEQSLRTNQIAAASQEMSATIHEISENASHASIASNKSGMAATRSNTVMQEAKAAMEQVGESAGSAANRMDGLTQRSQEIGKLVTVIHEISEQTNLLALNAAIEAARAGEQGRGFAVVAGEVRRLAERTSSATEEISSTVRNIQEEVRRTQEAMEVSRSHVETGVVATSKVSESLSEIQEHVQTVDRMIHLIASATSEQSAASQEISDSAHHISRLATANRQSAESSACACNGLTGLSQELDNIVGEFRLEHNIQAFKKAPALKRLQPSASSYPVS